MHKAHLMAPQDFLSLVLMKMTYGELHGVFAPSVEQVFDVYLPNPDAEFGRTWIAQMSVPPGMTIKHRLLKLHEQLVLRHWHRYKQDVMDRGSSLLDAPDMSLVRMYRYVNYDDLVRDLTRALGDSQRKPYFGQSPVSYAVFSASPFMPDVSVRLVGALKCLNVTDENGNALEAIPLDDLLLETVLPSVMSFIRGQRISIINQPEVLKAA